MCPFSYACTLSTFSHDHRLRLTTTSFGRPWQLHLLVSAHCVWMHVWMHETRFFVLCSSSHIDTYLYVPKEAAGVRIHTVMPLTQHWGRHSPSGLTTAAGEDGPATMVMVARVLPKKKDTRGCGGLDGIHVRDSCTTMHFASVQGSSVSLCLTPQPLRS